MHKTITDIAPHMIEARSFQIIAQEFQEQTASKPEDFPPKEFAVIQRVIHATGDFSFAKHLIFHIEAIRRAMQLLASGKNILTDVNMVAAGVSDVGLKKLGGRVICKLSEPEIISQAKAAGQTRTETAISLGISEDVGIVAIGNAPTALLKVMDIVDEMSPSERPLIIGAPVGFVNAAESKEILAQKEYPFICVRGRKGGSPIAAAICNALLKLTINRN